MDAMSYEILIRQANACSRFGVEGANTDVYRRFERAVNLYTDALKGKERLYNKTNEELSFDAAFNSGIVSAHIASAIYKVMREKGDDYLSDDQYESLEQNLLRIHTRPTKADIDAVINSTGEIFRAIGLLPH